MWQNQNASNQHKTKMQMMQVAPSHTHKKSKIVQWWKHQTSHNFLFFKNVQMMEPKIQKKSEWKQNDNKKVQKKKLERNSKRNLSSFSHKWRV